jgi:hypothetical protein
MEHASEYSNQILLKPSSAPLASFPPNAMLLVTRYLPQLIRSYTSGTAFLQTCLDSLLLPATTVGERMAYSQLILVFNISSAWFCYHGRDVNAVVSDEQIVCDWLELYLSSCLRALPEFLRQVDSVSMPAIIVSASQLLEHIQFGTVPSERRRCVLVRLVYRCIRDVIGVMPVPEAHLLRIVLASFPVTKLTWACEKLLRPTSSVPDGFSETSEMEGAVGIVEIYASLGEVYPVHDSAEWKLLSGTCWAALLPLSNQLTRKSENCPRGVVLEPAVMKLCLCALQSEFGSCATRAEGRNGDALLQRAIVCLLTKYRLFGVVTPGGKKLATNPSVEDPRSLDVIKISDRVEALIYVSLPCEMLSVSVETFISALLENENRRSSKDFIGEVFFQVDANNTISYYSDLLSLSNHAHGDDGGKPYNLTQQLFDNIHRSGSVRSVIERCLIVAPTIRKYPQLLSRLTIENLTGSSASPDVEGQWKKYGQYVRWLLLPVFPPEVYSAVRNGVNWLTLSVHPRASAENADVVASMIQCLEQISASGSGGVLGEGCTSDDLDVGWSLVIDKVTITPVHTKIQDPDIKLQLLEKELAKAMLTHIQTTSTSGSVPGSVLTCNLLAAVFHVVDSEVMCDFVYFSVPLILLRWVTNGVHASEMQCSSWRKLFVCYFQYLVEMSSSLLATEAISGTATTIIVSINAYLLALLTAPLPRIICGRLCSFDAKESKVLLAKYNKHVKSLLKHGIADEKLLGALLHLFVSTSNTADIMGHFPGDQSTVWLSVFSQLERDDICYCPESIIDMIAGHSKFPDSLLVSSESVSVPLIDIGAAAANGLNGAGKRPRAMTNSNKNDNKIVNATLLKLILSVVSRLPLVTGMRPVIPHMPPAQSRHGDSDNDNIASCRVIISALLPLYAGTLGMSDRLIIRIWHLLSTTALKDPGVGRKVVNKHGRGGGGLFLCAPIGCISVGCGMLTQTPLPATFGIDESIENISTFGESKIKEGSEEKKQKSSKLKGSKPEHNIIKKRSQDFEIVRMAAPEENKYALHADDIEPAPVSSLEQHCWLFSFLKPLNIQQTITYIVENCCVVHQSGTKSGMQGKNNIAGRGFIPNTVDCEGSLSQLQFVYEVRSLRQQIDAVFGMERGSAGFTKKSAKVISLAEGPARAVHDRDTILSLSTLASVLSAPKSDRKAPVTSERLRVPTGHLSDTTSQDSSDVDTDGSAEADSVGGDSDTDTDASAGSVPQTDRISADVNLPEESAFVKYFPAFGKVSKLLADDQGITINDVDVMAINGHSAEHVYDTAFLLPALLRQLQHTPTLSVKQMCKHGILSLVFACLCADCPVTRVYALCLVECLAVMCSQQTPEQDSSFRERPQYLLLFDFVRNSIDNVTATKKSPADLPLSQNGPVQLSSAAALFLTKAAQLLLTPTHEMYPKVNKYLISKPCLDFNDFPLCDLLLGTLAVNASIAVESADSSSDVKSLPAGEPTATSGALTECLSALRYIRDGLNCRKDHVNICRKNAYSRLMLLFPVFLSGGSAPTAASSSSYKITENAKLLCNVLLDILEKALCLRDASKYLIEKCNVFQWLANLLAGETFPQVHAFANRLFVMLRRAVRALTLWTVDVTVSSQDPTGSLSRPSIFDQRQSAVNSTRQLVSYWIYTHNHNDHKVILGVSFLTQLIELMKDVNILMGVDFLCSRTAHPQSGDQFIVSKRPIEYPWSGLLHSLLIAIQSLSSSNSSDDRDCNYPALMVSVIALGKVEPTVVSADTDWYRAPADSSILSTFCGDVNTLAHLFGMRSIMRNGSSGVEANQLMRVQDDTEGLNIRSRCCVSDHPTMMHSLQVPDRLTSSLNVSANVDECVEFCWREFKNMTLEYKPRLLGAYANDTSAAAAAAAEHVFSSELYGVSLSSCLCSALVRYPLQAVCVYSLAHTRWLLVAYFQLSVDRNGISVPDASYHGYHKWSGNVQFQLRIAISVLITFLQSSELNGDHLHDGRGTSELSECSNDCSNDCNSCLCECLAALLKVSYTLRGCSREMLSKPAEIVQQMLVAAASREAMTDLKQLPGLSVDAALDEDIAEFSYKNGHQAVIRELCTLCIQTVSALVTSIDRGVSPICQKLRAETSTRILELVRNVNTHNSVIDDQQAEMSYFAEHKIFSPAADPYAMASKLPVVNSSCELPSSPAPAVAVTHASGHSQPNLSLPTLMGLRSVFAPTSFSGVNSKLLNSSHNSTKKRSASKVGTEDSSQNNVSQGTAGPLASSDTLTSKKSRLIRQGN